MAKKLFTTPRGVLAYPYLIKPDTKFNAKGVYTTKLRLSGAGGQALAKQVAELMKEAHDAAVKEQAEKGKKGKVKQADAPFKFDEETGEYEFSFKMVASGVKKDGTEYTQRPALFDAAAKPITQDIKIGGGTEAKVSFEAFPFFTKLVGAGVSLRLKAVQILKLVEWGGDGSYYGFDNEAEADVGESLATNLDTDDEDGDDEDAEDGDF